LIDKRLKCELGAVMEPVCDFAVAVADSVDTTYRFFIVGSTENATYLCTDARVLNVQVPIELYADRTRSRIDPPIERAIYVIAQANCTRWISVRSWMAGQRLLLTLGVHAWHVKEKHKDAIERNDLPCAVGRRCGMWVHLSRPSSRRTGSRRRTLSRP